MSKVFIQIDKPFYISGDTINGYIYLSLMDNICANEIMVKFKGWESVRWYEERIVPDTEAQTIPMYLIYQSDFRLRMDSSDSEDNPGENECAKFKYVKRGALLIEIIKYQGERQITRFDQVLHNFVRSFIPAGQYSFPFSFKTGQNYPASFMDKSSKNDRRGRIKYEMQAFARGFNDRLLLLRTKQEIVMREMAPIKNDQQQMEAHVTSCCCIDQGTIRIQCYFEKNGYMPGEEARIYCKLDNTDGKTEVNNVDIRLLNDITYTSSDGHKKTFSETIFKKEFSGLGVGEKGERENVVSIQHQSGDDIKPTARGNRLHSVYYLQVEASLAAACTCCSDLPQVKQPVLIYPYIPVNYVFSPPPNWSPKVMPQVNFHMEMSSLGIKPNPMNMNVNMGLPSVQVNMGSNPFNNDMNNNMNMNTNMSVNTNMNVHNQQQQMHGGIEMSGHHSGGGVGVSIGGVGANASMRPF